MYLVWLPISILSVKEGTTRPRMRASSSRSAKGCVVTLFLAAGAAGAAAWVAVLAAEVGTSIGAADISVLLRFWLLTTAPALANDTRIVVVQQLSRLARELAMLLRCESPLLSMLPLLLRPVLVH